MKITKFFLMLATIAALFTACKKDKILEMPTITDMEVGTANSKVAFPGTDLHIEAKLDAKETISSVKLAITPISATGWTLNEEFTAGYIGSKNSEFHEHVDIPTDAELGKYRIVLTLTDQKGQVTTSESELELKYDPTLPQATNFEVGLNTAGNDLHLEANITAVNKIAKIIVEVHGGTYEKEVEYTDAAMVGSTTYNLHKHVNVTDAPKGHYHVHLKIVDQAGKENEFEQHFDKN
ncbi:DUF4625 domain-containing protein [Pedobacter insulae]|nr:DUF4625 domain-containing protein [Pedobacter insulae]